MHRSFAAPAFLALFAAACASSGAPAPRSERSSARDERLQGASRRDEAGWVVLHLEGRSDEIGFQHGWLAADEIEDALATFEAYVPFACDRDWSFFRDTAHELFWPKLDDEQRAEIEGIAAGARARGKELDALDVTAMNGWMEIAWYYLAIVDELDNAAPGNCSAFAATGSWTADGGIVIGHNAWFDYCFGERWNLVLDILPERGHRVFMDGFPGLIHSGDDFALNDAGLIVTETTISGFEGFDPHGVPEFARARKAVQYAGTIDEWAAILREGNNGGYANSWLAGDVDTGEIARLELGLKNAPLERTKDGCFAGANFPSDAKLAAEETTFDASDPDGCCNVRRKRWDELLGSHRGKIDVAAAERFLADHVDARTGKVAPSGRTLCGHCDLDEAGAPDWSMPAFTPIGAVQAKVTDSKLARALAFRARMGHPCGASFDASDFLDAHARFEWQRPFLRDMPAQPWTLFRAQAR